MNYDKTQLQKHTNKLNKSYENYAMKISTSKTEVMSVGRISDKLDIRIKGQQLHQTSEFSYVRSLFTNDGKMDKEIETRESKRQML